MIRYLFQKSHLLVLLALTVLLSKSIGADMLSTSKDGMFQAIAQGPNTITIYWKTGGTVPAIPFSDVSQCVDPVSGYSSATISSLQPDTTYSFTLGLDGPTISEKTWSEVPYAEYYDLLIVGGSASGVAAAVTAARLGMKVALVEETNRIGGMASNGLGSTDLRQLSRSNGFFEDFRRRIIDFYGKWDGLRYEPRVANAIFKDMVYEQPCISLFLKSAAIKPVMTGNRVRGAVVRDWVSGQTGRIFACTTIDATQTGDFAAACGCEYRIGREPRSVAEPHAGVLYFDDATQKILPGSTGEGDCRQQSYAYLMIWKDFGENGAHLIDKPKYYDPENYRYSPEWKETWNNTSGELPNEKFEINQHPFGIDWPGINNDYPIASPERRREIESMYKDRALGYLYYIQNEQGYKNLGLADDEFLDNGNFPVTLYVREARRIMGDYLFMESDACNARCFHRADSIAIGDYPMDSHAVEELKNPDRLDKGEGEAWLVKFTPWYQTPYGVLAPKGIEGLLVTTTVSSTHWGYGTLRMEPVRMSMGQAAAAAAYWSMVYSKNPRNIRPAMIQDKIISQGAYINWNSDITRESRHFKAINFMGARGIFTEEAFEPEKPLACREAVDILNRMLALENSTLGLEGLLLADPEQPITRGQFAVLLVEAKRRSPDAWKLITPAQPSYSDVPTTSPYFAAVETLKAHRISAMLFENPEEGKFKPDELINRADAAEAMYLAHRAYAMNYWLP